MEQHPIPRQITTFEFKLIGFLTVKQFIYLIIFAPLGFLVYTVFPIPILNILLGVLVGSVGVAFAFLPINDRPLDVWIRNLFKRLTSATQYHYQKQNPAVYFLKNLVFEADPHRVMSHIQSQELLANYLTKTQAKAQSDGKKQQILDLFAAPPQSMPAPVVSTAPSQPTAQPTPAPVTSSTKKSFFSGVVKNHKLIPIPGILIYVKNEKGEVLRLLKTNPHGVFATFNSLPVDNYTFEIKDPKNIYLFDTMKINIENNNIRPLEFFSKELL